MVRDFMSTEAWIAMVKDTHDDRYIYDKVEYKGQNKKVTIGCKKHGYFEMLADSFKRGGNCPMCNKETPLTNLEMFIEKAREVHGDKYDYSKVELPSKDKRITIICPKHGEFRQLVSSHLRGLTCRKCADENNRNVNKDIEKITNEFIEKARRVHGDKYDYSKVEYVNARTKVCIICPEHGEFWQTPDDHLNSKGCKKCALEKMAENATLTREEVIRRAREIHGDKYEYGEYIGMRTKMELKCPEHGMFYQTPMQHIYKKQGCPECGKLKCIESNTMTTEQFIERCKSVHEDLYDYSETVYNGWLNPFKYICHKKHANGEEHGIIEQLPSVHLNSKCGCPRCNMSHLEKEMMFFLKEKGIVFEQQKKFDWLGRQSLDFYLPEYNAGIECQGEQHFRPVKHFGGEENFEYTSSMDERKRKFCKENGVKLCYFTNYTDFENVDNGIFVDKEKLMESIECLVVERNNDVVLDWLNEDV